MTAPLSREDIDRALTEIVRDGRQSLGGGTWSVSGLSLLAEIVADQERRLRALEPCPNGVGCPPAHVWVTEVRDGLSDAPVYGSTRCAACEVRR